MTNRGPRLATVAAVALLTAFQGSAEQAKKPKRAAKATGAGGTEMVVYKTVGELELTLAVDLPEGDGPFPVVVYIHGGGWNGGSEGQFNQQSCHLTHKGIAGVRINYRKVPQGGNFDDTLQDCMDAVEWVRQNADKYHFDVKRLALAGGSAGGHLSAIVAQRTPECIAYIGFNGGYDLLNRGNSGWPSPKLLEKFLGEVTEARLKEASAIYQLKSPPPDTLLLHGTADTTIDPDVAVRFGEAIKAKGGKAEVKLFEGEKHGFFNPGRPKYEECLAALEAHLLRVFGGE